MEIDLNNIDFAMAVNTFHDDAQDKLEILTKMQLEFLRKFQHRVQMSQYHSEMIFEIRKIVSNIQEMYKDIKDYFVEMKVEFVYDFVRKIQTLMVIGYNHLSQALLITFDMYEAERKKEKQVKGNTCSCQTKNNYILSKDELKRLEHIDYTITSLQSEEQRLLVEMQTIYQRMMMQKVLIEKVKPSLACKQLQEMKDHIQTVMENNERLFEETYMMKFFEFHNQIKKLDKPQKITEVYHKMNDTLKQNFVKQTMKAANRIQRARRYNPQNMQSVYVQTTDFTKSKTKKDLSSTRQPNSPTLFKQTSTTSHYSLTKQRKLNQKMNIELNHLQKQNLTLTEQLNSYKFAEKQIQIKYGELLQKFSIVEEMYKKTKTQLDETKNGQQWSIQKLESENNRIRQENAWLRGKNNSSSGEVICVETQTDRVINRTGLKAATVNFSDFNGFGVEDTQTQTYEQYLLPQNDDEVVKLLKTRNQKAIMMLNEKDRKIRDTGSKISLLEDQNSKIKSSLNIFVGIVEEKFSGFVNQNDKDQNVKENTSTANKQSILTMNSYQIGQKIKQILKMIIPPKNDQQEQSHLEGKFKKLTSFNQKPFHTLPDQQDQNDLVAQLPNGDPKNTFSKTISDLKSQGFEQKKKKRLSVLNILANKKNFAQKHDAECQTQSLQGQLSPSRNLQTREFQTQTIIDEKNAKSQNKQKSQIRHSIQDKKQRPNYEQATSSYRKRKNFPHSNRSSETALSSRQKKHGYSKNLNTFQTINMNNIKKFQPENSPRILGRNGLPEFIQTHRKMISASSLTWRKDKVENDSVFSKQALKMLEISPFSNHKDQQKHERLSALLDESMEAEKLQSKYDQANDTQQNGIKITLNKSSSDTFFKMSKNLNSQQRTKLKRNLHNRLASEMASTFRPISEVSQHQKQNDYINIAYCPQNTYSGSIFKKAEMTSKLVITSNSQFAKMKADNINFGQRTQDKKKTLLLSIQKYKSENTNLNDILLGKYLTKVIEKWGKDKVKHAMSNLLVGANS